MKFNTYSCPKNVCGYKQTKLKITTIIYLQVNFEIYPHLFAHAMWINILRNINISCFSMKNIKKTCSTQFQPSSHCSKV